VGRRGRDHDEIDVGRLEPRGIERAARGFERKVARSLRFVRDVAPADAGALADPFVRGVEAHLREIIVADDARRQVAAGAGDARPGRESTPAMRCVIRCTTSLRASSTARCSAWRKAYASAEPWLLITTPFNPSRLAPL